MSDSTTAALAETAGRSLGRYRRARTSLPQWWRAARLLMTMSMVQGLWYWAIVLLCWVVAVVGLSQTVGVEMSYLQFVAHGNLWYPFALMIIVSGTVVTTLVANGVTRRSFTRAVLLSAVALAIGYGLLLALGLELEGLLYDANGWPQVHVSTAAAADATDTLEYDAAGLAFWEDGFLASWSTSAARTLDGALAGALVGIAYYRWGALRGTLALPLTVLPALLAAEWVTGGFLERFGAPVQVLLLLVPAVLAALAFRQIARDVPIKKPLELS